MTTLRHTYLTPKQRAKVASLVRELRTVHTPSLTIRERNQAIRANARTYARGLQQAN